MKIFVDPKGRKFQWKVRCLPISVDDETERCVHCSGSGIESDRSGFDYIDCTYCNGTGKMKVRIHCFDNELEKYLEGCIEVYYATKI